VTHCGVTLNGQPAVPETISDTGPILHLQEIGRLASLTPLAPLRISNLVWTELQAHGVEGDHLRAAGIDFDVTEVDEFVWRGVIVAAGMPRIQPADAQTFALARSDHFQALTLTDDQALRRLLERHGATVTGSIGVLVRAYTLGRFGRDDLDRSVEAILDRSSLHLSRAFRAYVKQLLVELP